MPKVPWWLFPVSWGVRTRRRSEGHCSSFLWMVVIWSILISIRRSCRPMSNWFLPGICRIILFISRWIPPRSMSISIRQRRRLSLRTSNRSGRSWWPLPGRRWLNRALSLRLISTWRMRSIFLFTTRSRKVSLVLIRPRKCKWIPVIIRLTLLPIKKRNSIGLNYIKGLRTIEWLPNWSPRVSRMPRSRNCRPRLRTRKTCLRR